MSDWIADAEARIDEASEGPWSPTTYAGRDAVLTGDGWGYFVCDTGGGYGSEQDAAFIAAARMDLPRALAAIRSVLQLHKPWAVYEHCGHIHGSHDIGAGATEVDDVGIVCEDGHVKDICAECCVDAGGQTEVCATQHDGPCWPCPTATAVTTSE